jgi:hypothetical protein
MSGPNTATITAARVIGGHDGRAEILLEITYPNGGTTTLSLDEEACVSSLDHAGMSSIDQLVGRPWDAVLPALTQQGAHHARSRHP